MEIMKGIDKLFFIMIIPLIFSGCYDRKPQEQLGVVVGLGYDVNGKGTTYEYRDTSETFTFKGEKVVEPEVLSGDSNSIYSIQDELQSKYSKKWIAGSEIVYLIGEERGKYGIEDIIEGVTRDTERRRSALIAISKQPAESVFKLKPKTYSTISEDLHGILEFALQHNFFAKEVGIRDFLKMNYQEGRKIAIPYIEIVNNRIQVTGLALFKGDKMVKVAGRQEATLINLFRNNNSYGFISVYFPERNKYYSALLRNKVKIKVAKENERLKYDVLINLDGGLKLDTVDEKLESKSKIKNVEQIFSEKIRKDLIGEAIKMQKQYGTDWLDLGQYAVAKYGRESKYGSDKVFKDSKIDIHVNVNINSVGQKIR